MATKTIRIVTRASNGTLRTRDLEDFDELTRTHEQIGIDDCSTDLSLRGMPIFRGLIGPMSESKTVVRYESPEVFETLTKEWSQTKTKRRRRRSTTKQEQAPGTGAIEVKGAPIPKMNIPGPMIMPQASH